MKSRHLLVLVAAVVLCFALIATTSVFAEDFKTKPHPEKTAIDPDVEQVRGEVLVKYREGVTQLQVQQINAAYGSVQLSSHRGGVHRLTVPGGTTEKLLNADCPHFKNR